MNMEDVHLYTADVHVNTGEDVHITCNMADFLSDAVVYWYMVEWIIWLTLIYINFKT